jgi:hypothetical protein
MPFLLHLTLNGMPNQIALAIILNTELYLRLNDTNVARRRFFCH